MKKFISLFKQIFSFNKKEIKIIENVVSETKVVEAFVDEVTKPEQPQEENINESVPAIKKISSKVEEKLTAIKDVVIKPTNEIVIGEATFKKYDKDSVIGNFGVVAFVDGKTGKIELGRTVKLQEYLTGISSSSVSAGRYGRGPQNMKKLEVYFYEVDNKDNVLKMYSLLNKQIYKKA